jgi:hypothetical protein
LPSILFLISWFVIGTLSHQPILPSISDEPIQQLMNYGLFIFYLSSSPTPALSDSTSSQIKSSPSSLSSSSIISIITPLNIKPFSSHLDCTCLKFKPPFIKERLPSLWKFHFTNTGVVHTQKEKPRRPCLEISFKIIKTK